MRYGIISDIHGNLEALEVVLLDLEKEKPDKYICVGDIVGYGADPAECINLVKGLNAITVAGNHDWAVAGLFNSDYFNSHARAAVDWTRQKLAKKDLDYLRSLPLVQSEKEITIVHGSLEEPQEFNYILDLISARRCLDLLKTPICLIGHSHAPVNFIWNKHKLSYNFDAQLKIAAEIAYIVNVGSVGQPRDGNPKAAYALYDTRGKGLRIKRISYDIRQAQDKIAEAGLPRILAERLKLGR